MAMHNGKLSCLLLFWLLLVPGNLLKNTSRFVSCLALLQKGNELKWVCGHHLVCICKLKLMHLGLCKEDFFALLLCRGHFHCLTEVATIKVAEKLHSMPQKLVHRHEGRLLGGRKPANQLVTNIGEPGTCLKVISMHSSKFAFVGSDSVGHCLATTLIHSVRPTS